ncbi:VOC family protein [Saccharopolyspora shandongensis]|uniref:VOC family protein n=1 Tax=Saccharopolyspora shandongensis TaxID=418495 RepID=UPI0033FC4508
MISLDHIAVWSDNLYRTTVDLSRATGLGSADGGYFPGLGLGQKLLSLGDYVYIEVESIVDHRMIAERAPMALELERQSANGDCFAGLCLRSDNLDEIAEFARHRGIAPSENIAGGKVRMVPAQGSAPSVHAPDFWNSWRLGKPNIYYVPDLANHSSLLPPQPGTGDVRGTGVISIEIGGTEPDLRAWLGDVVKPAELGIEIVYNGGPDGLYAVTFDSTAGPRTIRLNPITL